MQARFREYLETEGGAQAVKKLLWNETLNIGVDVVDRAHARLFHMVERRMDLGESKPNCRTACEESIEFLEDYTMTHFSEEEAYMRSIGYDGYEKHKKIHDHFRDITLVSLKKEMEASGYSKPAVQRYLGALLGWLTGHIMTEDQAITGNVLARKVYENLPDAGVVSRAVNHAMRDVFHLDAELVNAEYKGKSIRNGYYYRLCYDIKNGGKVQLLLGVEEHLARPNVGLMLGLSALKQTEMVRHASIQILEQFFCHLGKLFKSDAEYRLFSEEMLTRDEFRKDFMTRYPCSLLFETRLGHFIFCARK